jgi:hypothetical protein
MEEGGQERKGERIEERAGRKTTVIGSWQLRGNGDERGKGNGGG